jgi:SAM-dependent methyltransferase
MMRELLKKQIKRFDQRTRLFQSLNPTSRVLDLGCGEGNNGNKLKALHPHIELHGIDILPKERVPSFYSYQEVDLEKGVLPYPDSFFDAVVLTHVLEHLCAPLSPGREINRVTKKGGVIYVEAPNWSSAFVPSFGFHREQHNRLNFYDDPSRLKPWSKQGIFEFLFHCSGLHVVKVGTVSNWLRVALNFLVMPSGILTGNSMYIVSSFWNLFGWCLYGIGVKE